jgi:hypothetical protein
MWYSTFMSAAVLYFPESHVLPSWDCFYFLWYKDCFLQKPLPFISSWYNAFDLPVLTYSHTFSSTSETNIFSTSSAISAPLVFHCLWKTVKCIAKYMCITSQINTHFHTINCGCMWVHGRNRKLLKLRWQWEWAGLDLFQTLSWISCTPQFWGVLHLKELCVIFEKDIFIAITFTRMLVKVTTDVCSWHTLWTGLHRSEGTGGMLQ